MSAYRFCRTDDLPLLVEAFNACWQPHFPASAPLTLERFKRDVRELNLWASNCMLALTDDQPIGVVLGAKREDANLVHAIAILPGHERKGHGRHLLDSMRRKVSILGPRRLLAEVPAEQAGSRRFFERCGFSGHSRYRDFAADSVAPSRASELVNEIGLEDLLDSGALESPGRSRAWERSLQTLRNRGRELDGVAIASDERIEAFLLARPLSRGAEILAIGGAQPRLLHPLVARLYERRGGPLTIPKLEETELPFDALEGLGFRAVREHVAYAAELDEA